LCLCLTVLREQVFDSWGGELSPADFAVFSLPYLRDIATQVKRRLGDKQVPMVVFAKNAHYALADLAASDFDVIQLDWTIDPVAVLPPATHITEENKMDASLTRVPRRVLSWGRARHCRATWIRGCSTPTNRPSMRQWRLWARHSGPQSLDTSLPAWYPSLTR
jgi:hypothetical protein